MIRVTTRHVRAAGFCGPGFMTWLRSLGIPREDQRRFFREGWPVEEVEALNDALANRAAVIARAEATHGQ